MVFCQYADVFGRPGEGAHESRIFGTVATVDTALTLVCAVLIARWQDWPLLPTMILLLVLSLLAHRLFCVDTYLTRTLFGIAK
jgi:hypothetical protein